MDGSAIAAAVAGVALVLAAALAALALFVVAAGGLAPLVLVAVLALLVLHASLLLVVRHCRLSCGPGLGGSHASDRGVSQRRFFREQAANARAFRCRAFTMPAL